MNEIARTTPADVAQTAPSAALDELRTLAETMRIAQGLATSDLVPQAYRKKPENIVIAAGLGRAMGVDLISSLYRIHVIQGQPTASAELIASNVRRAGHRLEVDVKPGRATATITRGDDGTVYTVTRDMEWAKQMGLAGKDNWKKQPETMLQWRAITACARLAASESLYGVAYTADEIEAIPSTVTRSSADYAAPAKALPKVEPHGSDDPAEITGEVITDETRRAVVDGLTAAGFDGPGALTAIAEVIGHEVDSTAYLTEVEGRQVLAELAKDAQR